MQSSNFTEVAGNFKEVVWLQF